MGHCSSARAWTHIKLFLDALEAKSEEIALSMTQRNGENTRREQRRNR